MPMNILIVDDDQGFRRVVKRLLEAERELSVVGEAGDGDGRSPARQAKGPGLIEDLNAGLGQPE